MRDNIRAITCMVGHWTENMFHNVLGTSIVQLVGWDDSEMSLNAIKSSHSLYLFGITKPN